MQVPHQEKGREEKLIGNQHGMEYWLMKSKKNLICLFSLLPLKLTGPKSAQYGS
jgi:hypothetical protein